MNDDDGDVEEQQQKKGSIWIKYQNCAMFESE